ncbi:MAG: hypothetical protein JXA66_08140 [Oligoflexia bacterium]|nr:hypothetical protein [Oligoflexia bacterium]
MAIIFFSLGLVSCSSTPPHIKPGNIVPVTLSRVFLASYEYTWAAALKECGRFSLKITNKDAGIIQTEDIVTFDDNYETAAARLNADPRTEIKYSIEIKITPLEQSDKYPRTGVSVTKYVAKLNEFGQERPVNSNMTDENTILYRIKRLLELERLKIERNRNF